MTENNRFWENRHFSEFTEEEWESLCDGCGQCCLMKLEDDDTGRYYFTNVTCRLLDMDSCQCGKYKSRTRDMPSCVVITPDNIEGLDWLPRTCAYRLVAAKKELPFWHPLVSGNSGSVHDSGRSIRGKCISEKFVHADDLKEHIIDWYEFDNGG